MFRLFSSKKKKHYCEICQERFLLTDLVPINKLGPSSLDGLKKALPHYRPDGFICPKDLRNIRTQLIKELFRLPEANASHMEELFLQEGDAYPFSFNQEYQRELTYGEKLSQKLTPLIGSWIFIFIFLLLIVFWMSYNTQSEIPEHFDPFPFILLNLFLSCMAAIQAPIIMMSQNRIAKRERLRADEDFYTNLKSELEIRQLNAKFDAFLKAQGHIVVPIQTASLIGFKSTI